MLAPVYELLSQDSDVAALVGSRIYRHGQAPDVIDALYITWWTVVGVPANTLDGRPLIDNHQVQVDCWSALAGGDADVEALALAVRNAIEGEADLIQIVADGRDPETRRYRLGLQFSFWIHRT